MKDFAKWFRAKRRPERRKFAAAAGYSCEYFENHLTRGTRVPRLCNIQRIAKATRGEFEVVELMNWFIKNAQNVARNG